MPPGPDPEDEDDEDVDIHAFEELNSSQTLRHGKPSLRWPIWPEAIGLPMSQPDLLPLEWSH